MPKPNPKYASVRTHNPGAQWPNALAKKFGMTGFQQLKDGNQIAIFRDGIHGAASNMALLDKKYTGMTISDGQYKWSGQHRKKLSGWSGDTVVTHKMCEDPDFMIAYMRSIANAEAPNGAEALSTGEWIAAFNLYRKVIYGGHVIEEPEPAPEPEREPEPPDRQPDGDEEEEDGDEIKTGSGWARRSKTIWGAITGSIAGFVGIISSILDSIDNKFAVMAFLGLLIIGAISLFFIIKGRRDVQKVVDRLASERTGRE